MIVAAQEFVISAVGGSGSFVVVEAIGKGLVIFFELAAMEKWFPWTEGEAQIAARGDGGDCKREPRGEKGEAMDFPLSPPFTTMAKPIDPRMVEVVVERKVLFAYW